MPLNTPDLDPDLDHDPDLHPELDPDPDPLLQTSMEETGSELPDLPTEEELGKGRRKKTFYGHVRIGGVNPSPFIEKLKSLCFFVLMFNGRRIL